MSKFFFLQDADDDARAIAIPRVFSENTAEPEIDGMDPQLYNGLPGILDNGNVPNRLWSEHSSIDVEAYSFRMRSSQSPSLERKRATKLFMKII